MSNPTKRLLPFLLGLCLLFPVGCGQKTPPEVGTGTDSDQASGEEAYPLGFYGRRYEDYSFDILRYDTESDRGWTGIPNDIYVASAGADTLEQAVYSRNEQLRALLGANVTMKLWGNGLSTHLRQKLNDGSKPYDAVVQVTTYLYQLFNMGLIRDMDTLGLDTSFDWWDPNATDTFTIERKMFGAVSDMTYIDKLSTIGVFFRPDVVRDLEMDDPFNMIMPLANILKQSGCEITADSEITAAGRRSKKKVVIYPAMWVEPHATNTIFVSDAYIKYAKPYAVQKILDNI